MRLTIFFLFLILVLAVSAAPLTTSGGFINVNLNGSSSSPPSSSSSGGGGGGRTTMYSRCSNETVCLDLSSCVNNQKSQLCRDTGCTYKTNITQVYCGPEENIIQEIISEPTTPPINISEEIIIPIIPMSTITNIPPKTSFFQFSDNTFLIINLTLIFLFLLFLLMWWYSNRKLLKDKMTLLNSDERLLYHYYKNNPLPYNEFKRVSLQVGWPLKTIDKVFEVYNG